MGTAAEPRRAAAGALAAVALVVGGGCGGEAFDCDAFRWDRAAWSAPNATQPYDGNSRRQRMLRRLQACDPLQGKTRAQVRRLLGPPERVERSDSGRPVWVWGIGRRGGIGPSPAYLQLSFRDGAVESAWTV